MIKRIRPIALLCTALMLSHPISAQDSNDPSVGEGGGVESAAEYYEKALVAHNLGEVRKSYIFLQNALKDDPVLLPAHLLLAKVYLSMGQGQKAERQLLIAEGLGAHRSLIQNSLARSYLMQGKPEQLIDELFPVGNAPDQDAELLALRGEAHLQLEQFLDAQRSFTQAWDINPRSVSAILGRVQVMLHQGELDRAYDLARDAVEVAPANARAWYLKGTLANSAGDYAGALADFEQAAELVPSYLPAQIGRIRLLLQLTRHSEAADVVAQTRELFPHDPRTIYIDAVVQTHLGNEEAAEVALNDAHNLIKRFPRELIESHMPTLLLAGIVSFNLKEWEQADNYLSLYLSTDPTATGPRVLLARIEMEQRDQPEKAIRLLEPAVERTPGNVKALSILAEAYMKTGQHLLAAQLLRSASQRREGDILLRTQRAVNDFGLGRHNAAIDELSSVLKARPDLSNAGATLVVMLMRQRDYETAMDGARKLMLQVPDNPSYINLFGAAAFAAGKLDLAEWAFDLVLAMDPEFYPARENLAESMIQRGDAELARGHLERVLDRAPEEIGALMLLARSHESDGDLEQALRLSKRAQSADPSSADVAIYQAELLLRMREPEKAVEVAEAIQLRAENPDDARLLATLSRAYIANGQRANAQIALSRGSSLAGYNAPMLLEIAQLQREAGDPDAALWSLQKASEGEPEFLPTRIKYVEMLIELGRVAEAIPLAQSLSVEYPDEPYADHLMGLIHQRQGEHVAAFGRFVAALGKRSSPVLALRAYEAKRDAEGGAEALTFLEQWAGGSPADGVVTQTLAEGYYSLGQHDRALELFEQAKAEAPNNPMLLNNLAVVYQQMGDKRALAFAKRAHALLPSAPEIGDTLGWIFVGEGEYAEGLKHLRDARSRAAADPGISYHIAVALNGLGRTEEAIDELVAALRNSVDQDFAEREQALELLDQLRAVRSAQNG
ncbi:MAG: XrtA/PEP-CTERM system TPR-repeat protein PrsT [Thiohalocapsa sp.]